MEDIRVGLVEDNMTIRTSLKQCVEMTPACSLAFAAGSVESALDVLSDFEFAGVDIILLDIGLPGMSGLEGIPHIRHKLPDVDIIMLTTYDDTERIFEALTKGARSYISKKTSLKVIMDAVTTVYRGGSYMSPSIARKLVDHLSGGKKKPNLKSLSDRQMDIVRGLANGLSYKMIASQLNISIDTVRSHIKKIYKILEVNSKIEVVNMFK